LEVVDASGAAAMVDCSCQWCKDLLGMVRGAISLAPAQGRLCMRVAVAAPAF
jgi:hypothetical protein